jgi:1-phosphofructokinase family hexose kinase
MFVTLTLNPAIDQTVTVEAPLSIGSVCKVTAETRTPGGKGVNVAKMIAANGKSVTAGGLLGQDDLRFYERTLTPAGIACRFLTVPFATRTNTMLTDGAGHELKLNQSGFPGLEFHEASLLSYATSLTEMGTVVVLSGSLPVQFPADTYARLIRLFCKAGCATVLDTSDAALAAGLAAKPDVIKPNRRELEGLLNRRLTSNHDVQETLRDLMTRHEVIVMSDGPDGAWFASRGKILFATSPEVARVDTTGAGDTLLGQFCADYFPARIMTSEIAARAVAAGAAAVEQPGTPIIDSRRVQDLAAIVKVSSGKIDPP